MAVSGGSMEGGEQRSRLGQVLLGSEIDECGDTIDVPLTGRQVQRRPAVEIGDVDVRFHGRECRHGALVAAVSRQVQRRYVVRLVGVHRAALTG